MQDHKVQHHKVQRMVGVASAMVRDVTIAEEAVRK
jgi:hypothetical protein